MAARRVLPACQPSLVIPGELLAGIRPATRDAACRRAADHVAAGIVAGGILPAATADGGGGMQVSSVAVAVAAQRTTGQLVERVVAKRLRILHAGQRPWSDRRPGAGRRAYRACPGQASLRMIPS
jgi:hypothetical protein